MSTTLSQFRFVPKLDEVSFKLVVLGSFGSAALLFIWSLYCVTQNSLCKSFLTVSPTYGMLIPGDQPATVNVTVSIDNLTAQMLNARREVLEDILILRLENGRDYYITVKANYARSCFAMNLDELVLYKDPIRTIPLDSIERARHFPNELEISPTNALCIPKELWRVVDAIYKKGLQQVDIFNHPGIPEEVEEIREALDTGGSFGTFSIHSYVDCFLKLLSSLSTPVIPSSLFPTVEVNSENIQSISRRFLEDLPPVHYNIFVYVISFFREALLCREHNRLSAVLVARTCCKYLSPTPSNVILESSAAQRRAGMHLIMLHLLETNSI